MTPPLPSRQPGTRPTNTHTHAMSTFLLLTAVLLHRPCCCCHRCQHCCHHCCQCCCCCCHCWCHCCCHTAWFHERKYLQPSALHTEVLSRSGRGQLEVAALTYLIRTAATPRDASLALSGVSAVRHVGISQGRVAPWPDQFLKAFIKVGAGREGEEGREGGGEGGGGGRGKKDPLE